MIQIAIVDDHDVIRQGLRSVLRGADDIRVAADFADGDELLEALPALLHLDLIVLDISMSRVSGIDVLTRMIDLFADPPPVLFLTSRPEDDRVQDALKLGARGYITKGASDRALIGAIRTVAAGEIYLSSAARTETGQGEGDIGDRIASLSRQETRVFQMLCAGLSQKEIAFEMKISERTISTYKQRVQTKLGVSSTVELVRLRMSLPGA